MRFKLLLIAILTVLKLRHLQRRSRLAVTFELRVS